MINQLSMLKQIRSKIVVALVAMVTVLGVFAFSANALADGRSYGFDESKYQSATTYKRYGQDQFAIAQIGGSANGYIYDQWTYNSQVSTGIANGLRMHTYLWDQTGSNIYQTDRMLDYFLPKIQTPKGSIVALDYEAGASWNVEANTDNIIHGMQRIKDAGYTPVYYSYKPYTLAHVDWNRVNQAFPNSGWIAAYPDYNVRTQPYWGVFPSMDGVTIYQFTSTYAPGGLDGNISLAPNGVDITKNGYRSGNAQKPVTSTPAVNRGKQIHQDTHTYVVRAGDSWWKIANDHHMDMNALAQLNGKTINAVIYPGEVLRVADSGKGSTVTNKVQKPVPSANHNQNNSGSYVVKSGDSWWAIANRYGMNMYTLAQLNGKSIYSTIYPGEVLKVNGSANVNNTQGSTYTVRYGDSWWKIANDHGMSMYTLAQLNGKSIYSTIYPGEVLKVSGSQGRTARTYRVNSGDSLSTIAYKLGTTVSHLVSANGISNPNFIYPGQVLSY